eukprot:CAMPEP_0168719860 /NCGR_PEP_ID=MMETSP0724-20121128/1260_1 /TAXON_ID=265536 /ORGANISM="Amphiprora sp., Strain CCMP467" /LENGTH=2785 /DNA_ID=CAMNT_0008766435 /DNA_START=18 /DNA_END=8372 /DNA_ORIENTATION=-
MDADPPGGESNSGSSSSASSTRWTCEACRCNTNTESDTSCSVCGSSRSGPSVIRRHGRPSWFNRSVFGRGGRGLPEEFGMEDEADLWESVVDDVEMAGHDERASSAIESLAMEVSGMTTAARRTLESRRQGLEGGRQRLLDAARAFSQQQQPPSSSGRDVPLISPEELWRLAMQNAPNYRPQWMNPSQMSGRMRNTNGIQLAPLQNQIAHVPHGAGEGRAIRATQPLPRDNPFSSSTSSRNSRRLAALQEREAAGNNDGPTRKAFGFRVAFDSPSCEPGGSLGGCYLVGVTVASFTAYGEQSGLSQSGFFWGVEDGGSKYEGERYAQPSRGSRRLSASYSTEIDPEEVPMNEASQLFGARDVVTVICDMEARSLSFWRNDTHLGTLVTNLPRTGNLYPVAVPFNCGSAVAMTGLDGNPLPLLQTFTADAKRIQQEKEDRIRLEVIQKRELLFQNGSITPKLRKKLKDIFSLYTESGEKTLNYCSSARLFYRCGMKLEILDQLLKEKATGGLDCDSFLCIIEKVLREDDSFLKKLAEADTEETYEKERFRVGDKVELVRGFDKFEDAAGGPLRAGDRGTIVELQSGPNGERRSVRVLYNGRRWWYQPQAVVCERSGLIDSGGIWFISALLRQHGFGGSKFEPMDGSSVASNNVQAGDVVVPSDKSLSEHSKKHGLCVGRISADSSSSSSSTSASTETNYIMVEYVNPSFGPAAGISRGLSASSAHVEKRRIRANKVKYATCLLEPNHEEEEKEDGKEETTDELSTQEGLADKTRADLSGTSRLDGTSIESLIKECRKSPDSLASLFSAGLPESLLSAADVAERQMNSLEPREDLSERILALGALTLFTADQLFSVSPKTYKDALDLPGEYDFPDRGDNVPALSSQDENRAQSRRSRRSTNTNNVRGLVASIQQRRSFLLSLMSRGSIRQAQAAMEASGLSSRELSLSGLPPQAFSRRERASSSEGSGSAHENHAPWEEHDGDEDDPANDGDSGDEETTERAEEPSESELSYLDSIRRKLGHVSPKNRTKATGTSQLILQQRVFEFGLLPNSLAWTKGLVEDYSSKCSVRVSSVLRHALDEEGKSALFLAISFGCSSDVIKYLLGAGVQVGIQEIQQCIATNQPDVLFLILRHGSIPEDFDLSACSEEIKAVITQARKRQFDLEQKMRDAAVGFMVEMLRKLLQLALQARRHRSARLDRCSRAISEMLVGNVLLQCMQEAQKESSKKSRSSRDEEENATTSLEDTVPLGGNATGLLTSLPAPVLKQAFFDKEGAEHASTFLQLVEDYLSSKELSYAAAGLAALLCVLKHFPQLRHCSEMQRYGMLELVELHDELASDRCSEILSRQPSTAEPSTSGDQPEGPVCVNCPQKHRALLHVTRHSSFRCDLCGRGVDRGRPMHGCRECDWDACEDCTDLAESGLVKCTAIREISAECKKFLVSEEDMMQKETDGHIPVGDVVNELNELSESNDVEAIAMGLLEHDRTAVEELARLFRGTSGRITMHQFARFILPALHVAVKGLGEEKTPAKGRRSKKAKVGVYFDEDEIQQFSPARRAQFCKDLVKVLILVDQEKPAKIENTEETEADDEIQDEEGEGESELMMATSESATIDGKEIFIYAESSELLRRLQQILSLHERVSGAGAPRKTSNGSDLQVLTTPLDLELLPSSFSEPVPCARNRLAIKAEPLLALSELELHVLRGCIPLHPRYLLFCQRLSSDKAIILEKPKNSSSSDRWRLAQVLSFDEASGTHGIRYASCPGKNTRGPVHVDHKSPDLTEVISFGSEVVFVVLAARQYVVIQRDKNGKAQSTMRAVAPAKNTNPLVGTRAESDCGGNGWEPVTLVKCEGDDSKATCTLVSDDGVAYSGVQITALRAPGIPGAEVEDEDEDDENDSRAGESGGSALVRAFPFFAARTRPDDRRENETRKAPTTLMRTWSALSLVDALSPFDLSENRVANASRSNESACFSTSIGTGTEIDIVSDIRSIEMPPTLEVRFNLQEKLPGVEFSESKDITLVRALTMIHERHQSNGEFQVSGPHKLYFGVTLVEQSFTRASFGKSVTRIEPTDEMLEMKLIDAITADPSKEVVVKKPARRTRQNTTQSPMSDGTDESNNGVCEGLPFICLQSLEVIDILAETAGYSASDKNAKSSAFANDALSKKLMSHLEDSLVVVGGALPPWCTKAPSFAPRVFTYSARKALLDSGAFGISRSTYRQQESKVNVAKLRQRMASLRGRAVELVGEAFSGGAEDPTALQLQADELYGMEEALAARVRAMFRAAGWQEHSLQVAKGAVRRNQLLKDTSVVMNKYASDKQVIRRRLEIRFEGESGFDASGDEAGVTRGFFADVAEALLSAEFVASVQCSQLCATEDGMQKAEPMEIDDNEEAIKLPLWIPDMDSGAQVVIPTPRADEKSVPGVFPRPLPTYHPQMDEVLKHFRLMGRLFAAAMRDGFMFPLPLSSSFLKLVRLGGDRASLAERSEGVAGIEHAALSSLDLPRPGFLGGEVYAAEAHICRALDKLDRADPPLSRVELQRRYNELATDKNFARIAFGKTYDCSFDDYYQDRTFVDPLDPAQDENAVPLCPKGYQKNVTIFNVREWVALAKTFFLHDGVTAQANAFRQGVEDFFPSRYLLLFTAEELQYDVCGTGDDVDKWDESSVRKIFKLDGGKGAAEALVAVAAMGGEGGAALSRRFGPSSPTIAYLVKALLAGTPKQRRQFLSFVTSVPIVTPGKIEVVPIVSPSGDFMPMSDPGCLPRANTCARRLYLPKFDEYDTFAKVLWAVVREESKFKGFYEW